jgi:hypothetical protein
MQLTDDGGFVLTGLFIFISNTETDIDLGVTGRALMVNRLL